MTDRFKVGKYKKVGVFCIAPLSNYYKFSVHLRDAKKNLSYTIF